MTTSRDVSFGRLLAIANVLGERLFENDKPDITSKYLERYRRSPSKTFQKIHEELMMYAHKFGKTEIHLMDMFDEILANMDIEQFTDEPLKDKYLHSYHTQQHTLRNIMSVDDAAKLWGYENPGSVKNLCRTGKIQATKIGRDWVIDRNQPNPRIIEENEHD
ncbi:helix-turn-helix domain-containing protein [Paenibacillus chitinolyticus]|uniref:helix-turn-helix domain-containing protein n=1 Tax=Paenibacillus chitinolyticus TaxID=79263 RepID=UPI001C470465|nr:helix-turn-helix domain-containing protein [Paenibacillus chitinolyticus]MBV6717176.1 type I-C CRISPR-associated protein Cas8c/Csd1 [Paenibacillus chitinolyticus]